MGTEEALVFLMDEVEDNDNALNEQEIIKCEYDFEK